MSAQALNAGPSKFDKGLFFLYIATFPFLNALSPTAWMPLPVAIAILAAIYYALDGRFWRYFYFEADDAMLGIVFLLGIVAVLMNLQYSGQRNINYMIWYLITFFFPYAWGRCWLRMIRATPRQIGKAATVALVFAAGGVLLDFALINATGKYLSDFIPFASEVLMQANMLIDLKRPRGFAAEPGFTAMVLECLVPLAWLYLRDQKVLRWVVYTIALLGFLACVSAAGLLCFSTALVIVGLWRGKAMTVLKVVAIIAVTLFVLSLFNDNVAWLLDQVVGRKLDNLGGEESGKAGDEGMRYQYYYVAFQVAQHYPLGIGWGEIAQLFYAKSHMPDVPYSDSRSVLSLYFQVMVDAGVPAALLFLYFMYKKVTLLKDRFDADSTTVLLALLSVSFHHGAVLEFWYPMLWFLLGLAQYLADTKPAKIPVPQEPEGLEPALAPSG